MKNLVKAVLNVMKDVKSIDKSMNVGNGFNSYKGVADKDVKQIIGKSMEKNGLVILPIEVEPTTQVSRWTETYNGQPKQKQSIFTEVKTKYLLLHESGESQILSGYGHGVDSQDKGAGKATTYALKYALLYAFMVPTGKIDDADTTHSDNVATPPPAKPKLSDENYKKTLECNSKKGIQAVLNRFDLTIDQENNLLIALKDAKNA